MNNLRIIFCFIIIFSTNNAMGSEAGMPQLNPEFWTAQIFWLLLIFSTLYVIIWKIFLPKITYSVENRKSRIVNDLDEAEKLKENAEKKLQEYDAIIERSKKEAKKILEDGKKKLELELESKKTKFNIEIEKELLDIEEEISNLKKSSLVSIKNIAEEISSEIIKQTIDVEVNKSNVSAIVEGIAKKEMKNYI
jgi:F-type H+-transporting ATPase subunit b